MRTKETFAEKKKHVEAQPKDVHFEGPKPKVDLSPAGLMRHFDVMTREAAAQGRISADELHNAQRAIDVLTGVMGKIPSKH